MIRFYKENAVSLLIVGLVLFLGAHSVRIVAEGWRGNMIATRGEATYKGVYAVLSLSGLVLLAWGYGATRAAPVELWQPPRGMNHLAALLTLIAFVFVTAAYVPGNKIKARLKHPMLLGVKVWALAHLLSNGRLADVILFGAFLAWAVLCFAASRRRDRAHKIVYAPGRTGPTVVTVIAGTLLWAVFALYLHAWLIGVTPLGV
jgi:uncharacterized membrane protein